MCNVCSNQFMDDKPRDRLVRGLFGLRGMADLLLAVQDSGDLHLVSPEYLHSLLEINIEEIERAQAGINRLLDSE